MSGFPGNIKPADLFAARSREHSLPQRTHGQKDFICDYSEAQAEKLRLCREEQWQLLSEERVERLGSLVKAKWKPRKGIVELKSAAGKFWHTMGFTRHGKQCLQPEEAIYLLECVFSHLKRLGYILMRFDPSTVLSPYERQLNMECSRHKSGGNRRRKRKRSPSPGYQDKKGKINEHVFDEETNREGTFRNATVRLGIPVVNSDWPEKLCASNGAELVKTCVDNVKDDTQASMEDKCPISQPAIPKDTNGGCSPRWGFTEITFPNLGSDCMQNHLPQPDGVLLPKNIIGREVDLSSWRHRLNQKRERISRREQEQLEWESRYKNSVNADLEVKQCRNWREYKELLRGRISRGAKKRPPHLWNQAVTPLVEPGQVTSSAFLLEQIGILQTSRILDGSARFDEVVPDLQALKKLARRSGDVPVVFALVDSGDIAFYSFKDFNLPIDIYP